MHEGHRQRMYDKLNNVDTMYDHEILEVLLFSACPRKNTNPIAHALLDRFGSFNGIFNADIEELKTVEGVGESMAYFLKTVGVCIQRSGNIQAVAVLENFGDCKRFVSMRLKGKSEEFLEFYLLEKSGKIKRILSYTSADRNKVITDSEVISRNIALIKPSAIIVAHNHLNGSSLPSKNDDSFTKQLQIIANINNVKLIDHIIYADDKNIYSYNDSGRLDEIKRQCTLNNLIRWKTIN